MSTAELQNRVIKNIVNIQDDSLLEDILILLETESSHEIVKLTSDEKEMIEIGLSQIKNGETFSNDEVEEEMQQLLNIR